MRRFIIFVMLLASVFSFSTNVMAVKKVKTDQSLRRGETRTTLDPKLFSNPRVRRAYQVAKDIPAVLDSIYCYCQCEQGFGHKSLLSCYVDNHASQ